MSDKATKRPFVNNNCIGCWACISVAPDYFDYNKEYLSEAKKCETYNEQDINNAISVCPVSAISWI